MYASDSGLKSKVHCASALKKKDNNMRVCECVLSSVLCFPGKSALVCACHQIQGQWRKQLLKMFGPKLVRIKELINSLMKTARSAVSKTRFYLRRQPRSFENTTLVARWREHFRVFLAIFCSTLSKKRCCSTREFTHCLSTVSSQRWAVISRIWKNFCQTSSGLGTG